MATRIYDTAIIGGGLGGLALSIQLAKLGHSVIVLEKETYPFQKVCGEYISNESRPFLESIGLQLEKFRVPSIQRLQITSVNGKSLNTKLPLGGFGISRYLLDQEMAKLARIAGAEVIENCKADDVSFDGSLFTIQCNHAGSATTIVSGTCCAAYGKKSNIDVKWNRGFLKKQDKKLDNYIGVKYHIHADWAGDLIGLHNFKNGYCGISKIEGDVYCLCYMTKAEDVKMFAGDIEKYQESVLFKNPFLKRIFTGSTFLPGFPVTIAQINFQEKTRVEGNILMVGDAAGMITPLCGNGMSMALHSSKIAAGLIHRYLNGKISYNEMTAEYSKTWSSLFSRRMKAGRLLQRFFGKTSRSNRFIDLLRIFPIFRQPLIRLTHGKPF